MEGTWLSILDYAKYKNISISTIRRYIKAQRVKFKQEKGKYYLLVPNYKEPVREREVGFERDGRDMLQFRLENESLKKAIQKLQDEASELKMLIALYERKEKEKFATRENRLGETPPDLPNML